MTQRKPSPAPSASLDEATYLDRQDKASQWFKALRDQIRSAFEAIEDDYAAAHPDADHNAGRFEETAWQRDGGGGGVMSVMKGQVFEKVGVNISTVTGTFDDTFRGQIPGTAENPTFWASGISLVAHMRNPYVPAVHMNTRYINTGGVKGKRWFGGGADLTPIIWNDQDVADFHTSMKTCCDAYQPNYYLDFSAWCDDYFTLKHRNEKRGAGGIFYDYLDQGDFDSEFAFTRDVGLAFADIYPALVRRRMEDTYTAEDREFQLVRRGRYVEFNLLYDRGTVFGLNTGGNVEAILMSLPPEVRWP
jgi:coproporphyrinogen III oxidase